MYVPGTIRVLYVDDEPDLLRLTRFSLERTGEFTVDTAESAEEALSAFPIPAYDVIVSDYQMPGMDGIAFLREVRACHGETPFILFTGRGREEVVIEAINSGADFYIQKGGTPAAQFAELAHKIRQIVKRRSAELALRESEEKYRSLVELTPLGVLVHSGDGRIVYANQECLHLTGQESVDDLLGGNVLDYVFRFIHPDERELVFDLFRQQSDEGGTTSFTEWRVLSPTGEVSTIEIAAKTIPYGGDPSVLVLFRDVTEWKQAQAELQAAYQQLAAQEEQLCANLEEVMGAERARVETEKNFKSLVDNAPYAVYIQVNDRIVYINGAAVRLLGGTSADQLLGTNPWDRIHPAFHERVRGRVRSLTVDRDPVGALDEVFLRLDGTPVDVAVSAVPQRYRGERGVLVMLHDITDRKRRELELQKRIEEIADARRDLIESRQQLAEIAATVPGLIFQFYARPDGRMGVYYVSSRSRDLFGLDDDPETFFEEYMAHLDPRDHDRVLASIGAAVASASEFETEYRYITPSGASVWVQAVSRPVVREDEVLYNGVMLDITARKAAEAALEQRLVALTRPMEESDVEFSDLLDPLEVQRLQDEFSQATGVSLFLVRPDGSPITRPSNPCRLCRDFVRSTIVGRAACRGQVSPARAEGPEGAVITSCAATGILCAETRIVVGDRHIATWRIGQVRADSTGGEEVRARARALGVDGEAFAAAYREVPVIPRERFSAIVRSLETIAHQLSTVAYQNVQQARFIAERDRAVEDLHEREARHAVLLELGDTLGAQTGAAGLQAAACSILARYLGVDRVQYTEVDIEGRTVVFHLDHVREGVSPLSGRYSFEALGGVPPALVAGSTFVVDDPGSSADLPEATRLACRSLASRSFVIVPLLREGRLINTLNVVSHTPRAWTPGEVALIEEVAVRTWDAVERARAEEALREREEEYRRILFNLQDAYIRSDQDGIMLMVSPSAARIFGYDSPDEMVGNPVASLYLHPEEREQALALVQDERGITDHLIEGVARDGSPLWLSINVQFMRDSAGRVRGYEAFVRDITERRKMERAIFEANRRLGLLDSITRHDLLNQLTKVRGYTHLAECEVQDPAVAGYLSKIDAAADSISRQVEFIRTYHDLGAHSPTWARIDEVVARARRDEVDCSTTCRGVEVHADPMLEKVFVNLFENAVAHGGHVTSIAVRCERVAGGLVVVVEDDGEGVPEGEKEAIFEKGHGSHTGLGLFLAREILAITGITIRENGTPGRGARFEITVPVGRFRWGPGGGGDPAP